MTGETVIRSSDRSTPLLTHGIIEVLLDPLSNRNEAGDVAYYSATETHVTPQDPSTSSFPVPSIDTASPHSKRFVTSLQDRALPYRLDI